MSGYSQLTAMIGKRRFFILVVLLVVTGIITYAWQKILLPQNQILLMEQQQMDGERMRLQREIRELPDKYAKLTALEKRFEALKERGFINSQDRITARSRLDTLRTEAGLRGIQYNIKPQEKVDYPESYALSRILVRSNLDFDFKGLTDLEMRDFIAMIQNNFSGLVILQNFSLERGQDLNETNLQSLSLKQPVDFVTGKASFLWYSLIDKPNDDGTSPVTQAFGGQM
jgi:hypothetical protein